MEYSKKKGQMIEKKKKKRGNQKRVYLLALTSSFVLVSFRGH